MPSVSKDQQKLWHRFVAGGAADMSATMFTHPIDVMKVRLQLHGELCANTRSAASGTMVRRIAAEELQGYGLYRGLSAALLRHSVFSSLRQGGYGLLTYHMLRPSGEPSISNLPLRMLAGLVAGLCGAFVANPADFILVRMQADGHWRPSARRNYRHVFDGLRSSLREEGQGMRIWWRGSAATCVRAAVLTATQLPTYEYAKYLFVRAKLFRPDDVVLHVLCSTAAAATCSLVTCPVDVIKTRMMNMKASAGSRPYNGVLDCAAKTLRTEGMRGFWKGLSATFTRLAPHNILLWVSFEQVTSLLQRHC